MQDPRTELIKAMRAKLEKTTRTMPGSMALSIDLSPLAETAMEVFSGGMRIPTIPRYNPELAAERRWYGAVSTDEVDEGALFPAMGVTREGDEVVLHIQRGDVAFDMRMQVADAADFGLSVASAAYAEVAPAVVTQRDVVPAEGEVSP